MKILRLKYLTFNYEADKIIDLSFDINTRNGGGVDTREMVQGLRELTALPKVPGLVSSTHIVPATIVSGYLIAFFSIIYSWCT